MTDQDGDPTGSDANESGPVAAAEQWLRRQGLPVPVSGSQPGAEPELDARSGTRLTSRSVSASSGERGRSARPGHQQSRFERGSQSGRKSARRDSEPVTSPENPEETARSVVLQKLSAQARTRHELGQALRTKQVPQTVANEVLDRMEEVGLVDDSAFARDWVESRQQRRQLSRRALRHELETKGVDREQIDAALSNVNVDDEYAAALAMVERKLRSMSGLSRDVRYRRLSGALARRGFSGAMVGQVISQALDRADR